MKDKTATLVDCERAEFQDLMENVSLRLANFLETMHELRITPTASQIELESFLSPAALNVEPTAKGDVFEHLLNLLIQHSRMNAHPRSWGFALGSASPIGMIADFVASTINPNVLAWKSAPIATEIENQTVGWLTELTCYQANAAGIFVSGGTMANLIGLLLARDAALGDEGRTRGAGVCSKPMRCYISAHGHIWIKKAAEFIGVGSDAIYWVPVDDNYRMCTEALSRQIAADIRDGYLPIAIIATAGTVTTGAIDPIQEISNISQRFGIWLHVDGAYGALASIALPDHGDLSSLKLADSLALDCHKWLYAPLEAGCILVKDCNSLSDSFSTSPDYYKTNAADSPEEVDYHQLGPQNSRCFRALKVWAILKCIGLRNYRQLVCRDMALAKRLYENLKTRSDFEVFSYNLSTVAFRFVAFKSSDENSIVRNEAHVDLCDRNRALLMLVNDDGRLHLSSANLGGKFALRACIMNFRTTDADVDLAPEIISEIASKILIPAH